MVITLISYHMTLLLSLINNFDISENLMLMTLICSGEISIGAWVVHIHLIIWIKYFFKKYPYTCMYIDN